ncbi:LexA family transcriptional regulator [Cronobacter sakazakii]|nr:LexA family transcriptional regulator [Cronobacter sakazakii]EGT4326170.1 LexA family transcriptional regulator [Cronobacter sakazakii]EGT4363810.1 LexA family transcriptional regulator [Cronobacter sakazakii]ELY3599407.1 LexA family transcriptional regulator [Cronobacter sakazakii]
MTNTQRLTVRQQEVLALLKGFIREHGYPPTQKEVASLMGATSPNAAGDMLRSLQRRGAISIDPGVARGITINGQSAEDEAVALLRSLVNGDKYARENAILFLKKLGVNA